MKYESNFGTKFRIHPTRKSAKSLQRYHSLRKNWLFFLTWQNQLMMVFVGQVIAVPRHDDV
jgi:hypothetical protein